jgi:hypothetical protein
MNLITREQFQQLIRTATIAITGMDGKLVRLAYAEKGQPGFKQTDNVVFITVNYLGSLFDNQQDVVYKPDTNLQVVQQTKYTRVIEVMWSCYGPACFETADAIKVGILNRSNRAALTAAKIYPVPSIPAPRRAPYEMAGQWWERVDLTVLFNAYTERDATVPLIQSAHIKIYDDHGLQRVVNIEDAP